MDADDPSNFRAPFPWRFHEFSIAANHYAGRLMPIKRE